MFVVIVMNALHTPEPCAGGVGGGAWKKFCLPYEEKCVTCIFSGVLLEDLVENVKDLALHDCALCPNLPQYKHFIGFRHCILV